MIPNAYAAPFIPPPPPPPPVACNPSGAGGSIYTLQDFECMFGKIIGILLPAAGIIFFIMFLYGGFKYMTSGGNPQSVDAAHKTLTYAIGGLIVTVLSYIFLLVINYVTGAPITTFIIYQK